MAFRNFSQSRYADLWSSRSLTRRVDRGVMAGIGLSLSLIVIGTLLSGGKVLRFFDLGSALLVFGGTLGAAMVHFAWADLIFAWNAFKSVLLARYTYPRERIEALVKLAQAVRVNGVLHLEAVAAEESDPFFRRGLELTVDGQATSDVSKILENELRTSSEQAWRAIQVFETMGNYAPALGLIGTVVGLIQMLGELNDPSRVGPAMGLALLTTLYGAMFSNLLLLPVAGKLRNRNEDEIRVKLITIEGIQALARQENPIILDQRLQSFLPELQPLSKAA